MVQQTTHDAIRWRCQLVLEKFRESENSPHETITQDGNLLVTSGANIIWMALTGQSITAYSEPNAFIAVGDSSTAEAIGQTSLQAATNKLRLPMVAGYPIITTNQVQFRAIAGNAQANFSWNEWGIFNASTGGTMLNRKVPSPSLGTKPSTEQWQITVTLSLS